MKRLTHEQAEALRDLRKVATQASIPLNEVACKTCYNCTHEDHEPNCPICVLDQLAERSRKALEEYRAKLDKFLEHGPHPKSHPLHKPELGGES